MDTESILIYKASFHVPNLLQQHRSGEHPATAAGQPFQQLPLGGGEVDGFPLSAYGLPLQVNLQFS